MRRIYGITSKELQMYFYSPIVYVAFSFYYLIVSWFFSTDFLSTRLLDVQTIIGIMMYVYLFIIPLLTMRLVSEEKRQGTDELLFTAPISITEIVIGKFMAAMFIVTMLVGFSFIYPFIMSTFGHLNMPVLWLSYFSLLLIGAAMISIGLFASTLSSHQMVAGLIGFAIMLLLWLLGWLADNLHGNLKQWVSMFSLGGRVSGFQKGLIDLPDLIFYVMITSLFLILSIQNLKRQR